MAKTIYKYDVRMNDSFGAMIEAPAGAEIVSVQMQDNVMRAWAVVDPRAPFQRHEFHIIGTGHGFPDAPVRFLNRIDHRGLVFHVFLPVAP